jgi:hypothetical protein
VKNKIKFTVSVLLFALGCDLSADREICFVHADAGPEDIDVTVECVPYEREE